MDHLASKLTDNDFKNDNDFYLPVDAMVLKSKNQKKNKDKKKKLKTEKYTKIKINFWVTFLPLFIVNIIITIYSIVQIFDIQGRLEEIDSIENASKQL